METFTIEALNAIFEDIEKQQMEVRSEGDWLKEGVWLKEEEVPEMVESLLKDNEVYFVDNVDENKMEIQEVVSVESEDEVKSVIVIEDEEDNENAMDVVILDKAKKENKDKVAVELKEVASVDNQEEVKSVIVIDDDEKDNKDAMDVVILDKAKKENKNKMNKELKARLDNGWEPYPATSENVNHYNLVV